MIGRLTLLFERQQLVEVGPQVRVFSENAKHCSACDQNGAGHLLVNFNLMYRKNKNPFWITELTSDRQHVELF